jgi:hypothetical protein
MLLAHPRMRARIEEIQSQLLDELHRIDDEVQQLVWRRELVVKELRRCRDAFGHVGTHWRREPLPGDIDTEPNGTVEIAGVDLRQALAAMVRDADRPVRIGELHRMLLAHGRRPAGRASQAISNALRAEVAAGRVVRVDRGVYGPGPT